MTRESELSLFSPIRVGDVWLPNRLVSAGHGARLAERGRISERLVAYYVRRAAGGVGTIVTEILMVDDRSAYSNASLTITRDEVVQDYRRLADAVHAHDSRIFGQLFAPGREMPESYDGSRPVAYAPSAVPNERFRIHPRPLDRSSVRDIIKLFGAGAGRLAAAGFDGAEVVASHGYLPAQFLSAHLNRRTDDYGGDLQGRLRFIREVGWAARAGLGPGRALGLRISASEWGDDALSLQEVAEICSVLDLDGVWDYFSVSLGSMSTLGDSIQIIAPMGIDPAPVIELSRQVKRRVRVPVVVCGRLGYAAIAEQVIRDGAADLVGMTRALICDPDLPSKIRAGRTSSVRECISCNQACIGHVHQGHPVSCIQHPETGRELEYGALEPAAPSRRILVAGGGPAGLKAAAVAAARGHQVTLCERERRLGGQALLAQLLPGRSEFGGLVTNLQREADEAGVELRVDTTVTRSLIESLAPDAVVVATGGVPYRPLFEGSRSGRVVDAWQVLRGEVQVGARVVIADSRADWVALGLAERFAQEGCRVRLMVNGITPGEAVQQYVRNLLLGRVQRLGVDIVPYVRLHGMDDDTAYFQNVLNGDAVICEGVDSLVLAMGQAANDSLERELAELSIPVHIIGDCLAPRTAEEAVLDGLRVAARL